MVYDEGRQRGPQPGCYTRGLLLHKQGRHAEAVDWLMSPSDRDDLPGRLARFYQAMSRRAMGVEALREGRFAEAAKHLQAAAEAVGRHGDLAGYLTWLYAAKVQRELAAEEMERQFGASNPVAWRKLALARWRAGKREMAYKTVAEAIQKLGGHCELHLQLGLFYAAEQRYSEARASLTRAVEADGANSDAHYYLALAAASQSDMPAAARSFQRAFELRPGDLVAGYQLALAAKAAQEAGLESVDLPEGLGQQATGAATAVLARCVSQAPDLLESFLALPESGIDDELFTLLADVLRIATDEHPTYADLHYHRSRILRRLGQTDAAIVSSGKALEINPQYVQALIHLGKLCAETGRTKQAVDHLERAIACGGDWADVHCLVGELMVRLNRHKEAQGHLRRALELNEDYTRAAEAVSSLAAWEEQEG